MTPDLLAQFPPGATPRPEQARLLAALADAIAEAEDDPAAPRVFLVEAPPGVGKSHVAMTLARWSGDAYLLTSQKLLQDQYEREFGPELQLVKGRDNYLCERYPGARVPTSRGMCRRPRGPLCQCPYARAKAAALAGPIFCTNTSYFVTLRHWHGEQLRRRRLLVIDEAHNLEAQLVHAFTVAFPHDDMRAWFGAPLARLPSAEAYRDLMAGHLERLEGQREALGRALEALRPPGISAELFLAAPPSREEQELLVQRDGLESALARVRFFVDGADREWVVRYPDAPGATLELVPLTVTALARDLLHDSAELTVLSSAFLGHPRVLAEYFGFDADRARTFASGSPFALAQRRIVYRPVGALGRATLERLEPALFAQVAALLAAHPREKGLIHAPSYAAGRRLMADLAARAPAQVPRLIWVESSEAKARARAAPRHAGAHGARLPVAARGRGPAGRLPALPDRDQDAVPGSRRSVDAGAPGARPALVRARDREGAGAGLRALVPPRRGPRRHVRPRRAVRALPPAVPRAPAALVPRRGDERAARPRGRGRAGRGRGVG